MKQNKPDPKMQPKKSGKEPDRPKREDDFDEDEGGLDQGEVDNQNRKPKDGGAMPAYGATT